MALGCVFTSGQTSDVFGKKEQSRDDGAELPHGQKREEHRDCEPERFQKASAASSFLTVVSFANALLF